MDFRARGVVHARDVRASPRIAPGRGGGSREGFREGIGVGAHHLRRGSLRSPGRAREGVRGRARDASNGHLALRGDFPRLVPPLFPLHSNCAALRRGRERGQIRGPGTVAAADIPEKLLLRARRPDNGVLHPRLRHVDPARGRAPGRCRPRSRARPSRARRARARAARRATARSRRPRAPPPRSPPSDVPPVARDPASSTPASTPPRRGPPSRLRLGDTAAASPRSRRARPTRTPPPPRRRSRTRTSPWTARAACTTSGSDAGTRGARRQRAAPRARDARRELPLPLPGSQRSGASSPSHVVHTGSFEGAP